MSITEIRLENTVICHKCRKVYLVKDWQPQRTLKEKCPNCNEARLYWAVREKEE